jgi:hypothetical protein
MKTSSSIHNINADEGLGKTGKIIWILVNLINNNYCPTKCGELCIKNFCPEIKEKDWERIYKKSSPSRSLSDLFWLNIDWEAIKSELGDINIFDTGAGNGGYSLKINDFAKGISQYVGVDYYFQKQWEELMNKHTFVTMRQHCSNDILDVIPNNTNFFITQSAIEHFEDDLLYFLQVKKFIERTNSNIIQVHLFPSAACLKLYPWHGVRQYTPRTILRITKLFNSPNAYSILFRLGGRYCNNLHYQYITRPLLLQKQKVDFGDTRTEDYRDLLKAAIENDIDHGNHIPNFYALVIHSNFTQPIFKTMERLTRRCAGHG